MKPHVFLLIVLTLSSCYNRFSCGPSQNKNLGTIDLSKTFKSWNLEQQIDTLFFVSKTDTLVLVKKNYNSPKHKQVKAYNICQRIDIKPYTAYAYYEYPNKASYFQGDDILLHLDPEITLDNETREETLYLNLAHGNHSLKAAVPLAQGVTEGPFFDASTRFVFKDSITLQGVRFRDVWVCDSLNSQMYYSASLGLVGIGIDGRGFLRE